MCITIAEWDFPEAPELVTETESWRHQVSNQLGPDSLLLAYKDPQTLIWSAGLQSWSTSSCNLAVGVRGRVNRPLLLHILGAGVLHWACNRPWDVSGSCPTDPRLLSKSVSVGASIKSYLHLKVMVFGRWNYGWLISWNVFLVNTSKRVSGWELASSISWLNGQLLCIFH